MTAPAATRATTARREGPHVSFPRLVRSETIKLFTLRSTWWSLAITVVLAVGISVLFAFATRGFGEPANAVTGIVLPMQFTMLVAGVLGAMAITGEYSTGMIRSTLTAQPRRGAVLLAKAVVVGVTLAVTTVVTSAVAALATAPITGAGIDWSDPQQSVVPLAFGVLAMATFALIGLGWGFLIRTGAGAIAATVGVLFVLPIVLTIFVAGGPSWAWVVQLGDYLPSSAAVQVTTPGAENLAAGILTLLAWPTALLVGGWVVLRTRDA
ncbi:ABC transporter permease [Microbacterium sp. 179-B 1A2 NHS]|uniref:ABC transporter permease subunit n=1 Tax=Microbacterium sp. 179-B 1A2 NHS TaxID=3142383 RepID=UPI0039A04EFB